MAYLYDLTDTWNAAGTVFNAIKMNVTNTASAAGSKIVALQVGATDRFTVDKDGNGYFSGTLQAVGSITSLNLYLGANSATIGMQDNTASILAYNATGAGGITNTLRFVTGAAERVRIDGSGNVGIGTSSPSQKLTLQGAQLTIPAAGWSSGQVAYNYLGDTSNGISNTNGSLQTYFGFNGHNWLVNGTEAMRIDGGRNVGIGTSSPNNKLDVNGNVNIGAALLTGTGVSTGDAQIELGGNRTGNGAAYIDWHATASTDFESRIVRFGGANGIMEINNTGTGGTVFNNSGAAAMAFQTSATERMRIDASGNVGIGTSSITAKLDVFGDFVARTNASGGNSPLNVKNDSTASNTTKTTGLLFQGADTVGTGKNVGLVQCGPSDQNWVTSYLAFQTRSGDVLSERARIDSSGNLLVGTTSAGLVDSHNYNYTVGSGRGYYNHVNGTGSGADYLIFGYNATQIGSITQNGTTAVAYNTTSDYRLKTVDGPITNSGAYIDALNPVQGSWKADGSRFIGLIAHEVQEVSETQIATGVKDGEEMQAMDYSAPELIANLIAEIQSLRARVAQLEGK